MIRAWLAILITTSVQAAAPVRPNPDLDRFVTPITRSLPCPRVVIDESVTPAHRAWAEKAKAVVEAWYPQLTALLSMEGFSAPEAIRLTVVADMKDAANASGTTITINGRWIAAHTDDLGVIVHELAHILQDYPASSERFAWLREGIADYLRWWRYEPEAIATRGVPRLDPGASKYTDSYQTTAYWLAWLSKKYDARLVRELDRALRRGQDPMGVFTRVTGKDADALWAEFLAQRP